MSARLKRFRNSSCCLGNHFITFIFGEIRGLFLKYTELEHFNLRNPRQFQPEENVPVNIDQIRREMDGVFLITSMAKLELIENSLEHNPLFASKVV